MADVDKISDPHLYHLFDGEPILNVYKSEVTNLSAGTPGPDLLKNCIEMFRQATIDRMAKEEENAFLFQYGITSGLWEYRVELAKFLSSRYGEKVHRENLILSCGATHGLQIILTTILQPNGVIFVEEATYMIALDTLKQFSGMKIVTVPLDAKGIDIAEMKRIVMEEKSKGNWNVTEEKPFWAMFYTIPVFHNPTGTTLPKCHPPRRLFAYDAMMEGYKGGHVISNGSFSKIMAPGVRVGWLEAPARLANERMSAVCNTLETYLPPDCTFVRPRGGYFVWITLPCSADMNEFVPWCQKKYKLSAIPGSKFSLNGKCRNFIRLAIAFHSKETLVAAAEILCKALNEYLSSDGKCISEV
ncbi:hypothetical protein C0J52_00267 [Blattella germanica]|nr:hypothetical protein C0J52_00267 [Blattella germanica]